MNAESYLDDRSGSRKRCKRGKLTRPTNIWVIFATEPTPKFISLHIYCQYIELFLSIQWANGILPSGIFTYIYPGRVSRSFVRVSHDPIVNTGVDNK
jgi:uncharacterized integral membrane protein